MNWWFPHGWTGQEDGVSTVKGETADVVEAEKGDDEEADKEVKKDYSFRAMHICKKYMVSTFEGIDIDIKYDKDMGKLVKHIIIIVNVEAILIDLNGDGRVDPIEILP